MAKGKGNNATANEEVVPVETQAAAAETQANTEHVEERVEEREDTKADADVPEETRPVEETEKGEGPIQPTSEKVAAGKNQPSKKGQQQKTASVPKKQQQGFNPKRPPQVANGIKVVFQASVSFDTQLFDFRQIDSLIEKLEKRFGAKAWKNKEREDDRRTTAILPNDSNIEYDELKKSIVETYIEEALGVNGMNETDNLASKVAFAEVMIGDVDTAAIASKNSDHWGVIFLTDAASAVTDDGRKYRTNESYAHFHQTRQGFSVDRSRLGLQSTTACNEEHQQAWRPIISRGIVMTYRLVAVVEKRPNYFVPQYAVAKTTIFKDAEGKFQVVSFAEVLEPKNLIQIVQEQTKAGVFRMNYYLETDLCKITDADLGIEVIPQSKPFDVRPQQHAGRR